MTQSSDFKARKTIYLTRHGQTDYNQRMIVQGSGIDSDLNDTGREQAQRFHRAFQHVPFSAIYVSQLKRTHQTIAPFVQQIGTPIILPELNEISWGILEGKEPTTECYDQFRTITAKWKNGHYDVAIEGGESPQQMFERQKIALNTLMSDPHETVLVCMHGRALRSFLCLLTDTPLCDMDQFPHENTGLYILEHQTNAKFEITTFNYTDHLN
jgi:probable phosphoglycerate mutase